MHRSFRVFNPLLICLILLEHLFLYYFFSRGLLTQGKNAWGIFLCSLLVGICLVAKFMGSPDVRATAADMKRSSLVPWFFAFLGGLIFLGFETQRVIATMPIDPGWSDVVPMVMHQCTQFLKGLSPYSPVNYFGYPEYPNNLPMKWLPYVLAQVTKTDYRLFAYLVWALTGTWLFLRAASASKAEWATAGLMLLLSQYMLLNGNAEVAGETIEILIASYYMLFIVALNIKSGVVQGGFIALCLLSRYSLVLWLPLYAFVLFVAGERKNLSRSVVTAFLCCVLLLVLFLGRDFSVIVDSYVNYDQVANFEWAHHHNAEGKPGQLFAGAGFAYFINTRLTQYSVPDQIIILQRLQFAAVTVTITVLGIWYWFIRNKINFRIFLMASFKIYLAVFLFFIKIPYMYLMCVGGFVSVAIFCEQLRYNRPPAATAV